MTSNEAKKLCKAMLAERGLTVDKMSAKTWDFSDLARERPVFVTLTGLKATQEQWLEIKSAAKAKGFYIQT